MGMMGPLKLLVVLLEVVDNKWVGGRWSASFGC